MSSRLVQFIVGRLPVPHVKKENSNPGFSKCFPIWSHGLQGELVDKVKFWRWVSAKFKKKCILVPCVLVLKYFFYWGWVGA